MSGHLSLHVHGLVVGAALLGLVGPADAQGAPGKAPTSAGAMMGFGTNFANGVLWGGGPDYKVRFEPGATEFTPALGMRAEHDMPLTLVPLSFSRGGDAVELAPVAPRRQGDTAVLFDRAPGVAERHELQRDGMELSFEFATRPAGAGDLVVRVQARTELPGFPSGGGWRFELPGLGGVGVGAVSGLDAQGQRIDGALRLAGDVLELVLPAAFVDAASYPLTLDPFIFPVTYVAPDTLHEEGEPDVAYDSDVYLVVWSKVYSTSDIDIRGQWLDTAGNIVGSGYWFLESASDTVAVKPQVASMRGPTRFMIVWQQSACLIFCNADIVGCSLSTSGFGQSAQILIAGGGGVSHNHPDVGGHSKSESNVCSVVWEESGTIYHRNVFVAYPFDPSLVAGTETLSFGSCRNPAISKSGGDDYEFLVVYERFYSDPAPGDHDIAAATIDVLGNPLSIGLVVSTVGPDERDPDVDGDGNTYAVVYSRAPSLFSNVQTVHAARVVQSPPATVETLIADDTGAGLDNREPAVAFTGNGFLVAWSKQYSGTDYDIAVVGLDPWANTLADPLAYADFTGTQAVLPALGARYANEHFGGDGAMCAWQVAWGNGDDDVQACAVNPEMGVVTDLGGATPLGGKASVSAATVGNAGFTHFYDGLYPSNPVTLLIGLVPLNAPLCTGTLVPNPLIVLTLLTGTDTTLVLPTPMPPDPALLGVTIYEQYSEKDLLTSPCGKKIQLSNALSILIE